MMRTCWRPVGRPVLTHWPGAVYAPAFATSYMPFLYTAKASEPGKRYLLHNVLLEDVVVLWLAFAWTQHSPVLRQPACSCCTCLSGSSTRSAITRTTTLRRSAKADRTCRLAPRSMPTG